MPFTFDMPERSFQILSVDDDRDAREIVKIMLERADEAFVVTSVSTAAEALDISSRREFDLYVLDIWLPGMDGMSLCRRLRERGSTTPIIFFSAMVRPTDREYGLAAGANVFLVKPADLEEFVPPVRRLLSEFTEAKANI